MTALTPSLGTRCQVVLGDAHPVPTVDLHYTVEGKMTPNAQAETQAAEAVVETESLVEEVSIDGMCGVY